VTDDFRKIKTEDELKEKILSSVREAFTGEETSRWMVAMQEESVSQADEPVATASNENKLNDNMASVIDRLFDNFKRYAFEFNRSLEQRELVVNCERPSSMRSQADYVDYNGPIRFCTGHISSRDWALVFLAEEHRVRGYIAPIKYLVGFRPDQRDFEPYVELLLQRDRVGNSRQMVWTINGQLLALESIPTLSRRFFGQLVKVTRGEASSSEKFVLDPNDLKIPVAEPVVERSYELDDKALFFSEKKSEPVKTPPSERPGHTLAALANVGTPSPGLLPVGGPNPAMHTLNRGHELLGQESRRETVEAPTYSAKQDETFDTAQAAPYSRSHSDTHDGAPAVMQYTNPAGLPRETAQAVSPENASYPNKLESNMKPNNAPDMVSDKPAPALQTPSSNPFAAPSQRPAETPGTAAPDAAQTTAKASSQPSSLQVHANGQANGQSNNGKHNEANAVSQTYYFEAQSQGPSGPSGSSVRADLEKEVAENNRKVAHSIKSLFDSVDGSITSLKTIGLEAMNQDDISAVSDIMKQTKTLKVLRDGIVQLSKDWQKSLEESNSSS
jgi:hypothetical protein